MTEPSSARIPSSVCSLARSVSGTLILVVAIVPLAFFLVVLFTVLVVLFLVVEVVVFVLIVIGELEFERAVAGDAEERTALRARQFITKVDVRFVDIDVGIALGTCRGH
jgi:hypothetical protein